MSVSIYAGNFNKDNNVKETSINYKQNEADYSINVINHINNYINTIYLLHLNPANLISDLYIRLLFKLLLYISYIIIILL